MPPTYAELEAVYAQNKRIADFLKVPQGETSVAVFKLWNQVFALLPPDRPDPKTLLLLNKNEVVAILEAVAPGSSKDMWDYDYAATSKDEWWRFLNEERNRFYIYMRLFNLSFADCDDHARRVMTSALNWFLLSKTKEWLPRAACGLVMGMKSPPDPKSNHMWNWVIDRDKKLWMHEPNPFFTTLMMWEPVLGDGIDYGHVYKWYGI